MTITFPPLIWALILYQLADIEDLEHFQIVRRNQLRTCEGWMDYEIPLGFLRSIRALAATRLICRKVNEVLALNTWWYTFWSKRGISDIRFFRPITQTWWNVAEHFCKQRKLALSDIQAIPSGTHAWSVVNMRSVTWSSLRENQLALLDAEFVVNNCPKFFQSRAFSNLSVILIKLGEFEKALTCCEKALAIDENEERSLLPIELHPQFQSIIHIILNNKGVVLTHLERLQEAEIIFRRAILNDGTLANSRLNLAYCLFKQQRKDECNQYCDEALKMKTAFPAAKLLKSLATDDDSIRTECLNEAWETGPYKTVFIHMLNKELFAPA